MIFVGDYEYYFHFCCRLLLRNGGSKTVLILEVFTIVMVAVIF
jgi:hypothetical protein